jgi:hypothetical protein
MQIVHQSASFSHSPALLMLPAPPTYLALPAPRVAGLLPAPHARVEIVADDPLYDTDLPFGWKSIDDYNAELEPLMERIAGKIGWLDGLYRARREAVQ